MSILTCPSCGATLRVTADELPADADADPIATLCSQWATLRPLIGGTPNDAQLPHNVLTEAIALSRRRDRLAESSDDPRLAEIGEWLRSHSLPTKYGK